MQLDTGDLGVRLRRDLDLNEIAFLVGLLQVVAFEQGIEVKHQINDFGEKNNCGFVPSIVPLALTH